MLPRKSVRCALVALACAFALLTVSGEVAQAEVEYMVKWIAGDDAADGYRVHYGNQSGAYSTAIDFGSVAPDADGVSRRPIMLDESQDHYLVMDAYNSAGLSAFSNQILVEAATCDPGSCDDGNECTVSGCSGESCTSSPVPDGTLCGSGNQVCVAGACQAVECLTGNDCSDGNFCNGTELCSNGFSCVSGTPPSCGAPTQCTAPACDPAGGCTTVDAPNGTPCNDGLSSTADDHCDSGSCVGNLISSQCGDGVRVTGEECDDGNNQSGDGCSASCMLERCGDGVLQAADGEECDDGNLSSGDGCRSDCTVEICGDGVRDLGEQCEDGNGENGDGCSELCRLEVCGDGVVQAGDGEECDDANLSSGDGCSSECLAEACGNGRLDFGEGCDDGNTADGDGCDSDCTVPGCGNGSIAPTEECDDGNPASGDGCDANCTGTGCGNGVLTDGEVCDDGNLVDGDGCSALCDIDLGTQSRAQRRCITAVNRNVARVAQAQGRVNGQCLAAWVAGRVDRLGPPPATFDSCMEMTQERVARALERLADQEQAECLPEELPDLALGEDRLSGALPARYHMTGVISDLFGSPAAFTPSEDARITRCQRQVAKRSTRLFDAFWSTIVSAKNQKVKGRQTEPAGSDAELSEFIEAALVESAGVAQAGGRLERAFEQSCADVGDLAALFPGCAADPAGVAACADRSARCRACLLLGESDPLLSVDCDWLDDGELNLSCQP
jgi:cysteine-rich repeat protein